MTPFVGGNLLALAYARATANAFLQADGRFEPAEGQHRVLETKQAASSARRVFTLSEYYYMHLVLRKHKQNRRACLMRMFSDVHSYHSSVLSLAAAAQILSITFCFFNRPVSLLA